MPKTAASTTAPAESFTPILRALVVEGDETTRHHIAHSLRSHGYEVSECATEEEARRKYHEHALVVAPIGDSEAGSAAQTAGATFVNWLRLNAGKRQPYILAVGGCQGERSGVFAGKEFACNAVLPVPIEQAKLDAQALQVRQIMGMGKTPAFTRATAALDAEEELVLPPFRTPDAVPDASQSAPAATTPPAAAGASPSAAATPGQGGGASASTPAPSLKPGSRVSPFRLAAAPPPGTFPPPPTGTPGPVGQESVAPEPADPESPAREDQRVSLPIARKTSEPESSSSTQAPLAEVHDITPHSRTEAQPHHLHILIENAPIAMAMFDREMNYLVANKLWLKQFNLLNTSLIGRSHFDVFPALHDSWRQIYARCLAGRIEHCRDDVIARADGSHDWVDWEVRPWRLANRDVAGLIITCEIVSARKEAEDSLLFERQFTYSLLESRSALVLIVDLQGKILHSSEAARLLAAGRASAADEDEDEGLDPGLHSGLVYWEVHTPSDQRESARTQFERDVELIGTQGLAGLPRHRQETILDAEGRRASYLWSASPFYDEHGMITGLIRIGVPAPTDLDALPAPPQTEPLRETSASGEEAAAIKEAIPVHSGIPSVYQAAMVWQTDSRGSMVFLSEAWHRFTGIAVSKQLGTGWMESVHEEDRKAAATGIIRALNTASPIDERFRFKAANGEYRWILLQGTPQVENVETRDTQPASGRAESGQQEQRFSGYSGTCTDITNLVRESEARLEEERATLTERASEAIALVESKAEAVAAEAKALAAEAARQTAEAQSKPEYGTVASDHSRTDSIASLELPPLAPLAPISIPLTGLPSLEEPLPAKSESPERARPLDPPPLDPAAEAAASAAALRMELQQAHQLNELNGLKERCRMLEGIPNHVPFGVVLLDDEGAELYSNPQMETILGRKLTDHEQFEDWLGASAPDPECATEIIQTWRDYVWRRQLTKTFTLSTTKGFLKEIEFRPRLLRDGTLILAVVDVTESKRSEEALRASEAKFRTLFQDSGVGIALVEASGPIYDVNTSLVRLLGFSVREFRQLDINDCIVREDCHLIPKLLRELEATAARSGRTNLRMLTKMGGQVSVRINLCQIRKPDGELIYNAFFIHETQPISGGTSGAGSHSRFDGEVALPGDAALEPAPAPADPPTERLPEHPGLVDPADESEVAAAAPERDTGRSLVFNNLNEALLITDAENLILEANPAAYKLFRFETGTLAKVPLSRLFCPDNPGAFNRDTSRAIEIKGSWSRRTEFVDGSGKVHSCHVCLSPLGHETDAPERLLCLTTQPEIHAASGGEDPAFGPDPSSTADSHPPVESHHSLKNNLQVINSLLSLQLGQLGDGESDSTARHALLASQKRIRCISLVHQRLISAATSEHPGFVDFAGCIRDITTDLLKSRGQGESSPRIRLSLPFQRINPALRLGLRTAVPLVLIANELISNSIQYAFPCMDDAGTITVNLEFIEGKGESGNPTTGILTVSDDGVGIDPGIDIHHSRGLGLQLVHVLASQLHGELEFEDSLETIFRIRFSPQDRPK